MRMSDVTRSVMQLAEKYQFMIRTRLILLIDFKLISDLVIQYVCNKILEGCKNFISA